MEGSEIQLKDMAVLIIQLTFLSPISSVAKLSALTNMAENPKPSRAAAG